MNFIKGSHQKYVVWLAPLFFAFLNACTTISVYDQFAYATVTGLKVDTLNLISVATESYDSHTKEIAELTVRLEKAYEYDRGRALNEKSVQLWEKLLISTPDDPNSGIYQRFLAQWKTEGHLSATTVALKKSTVSRDFDKIIELESGKAKS
jgi:hypothetical protein